MASTSEWRIHRKRGECVDCGRPFEDGERVLSSLVVREDELARLDRCPPCHGKARQAEMPAGGASGDEARDGAPGAAGRSGEAAGGDTAGSGSENQGAEERFSAGAETVLYWWAGRFRAERKLALQLDLESLERLFLDLADREERLLRELRYLVTLLLMRKRRLKLIGVRRGRQGEAMLVRRPRRQESLEVFVCDLDSERMGLLRERLQDLLDGAAPEEIDSAGSRCEQGPEAEAQLEAAPQELEGAVEPDGAGEGGP